jgi:predicted N-acetyltransferase YhbS
MIELRQERPADRPAIIDLLDAAFGPDRDKKVCYRYREGLAPVGELSFVARQAGRIVGTIRQWPVLVGEVRTPALLLGPVAVDPALQGLGIGSKLVRMTLAVAGATGHRVVLLVGDPAYYQRFGFVPAAPHGIVMADENPARLQVRRVGIGQRLPSGAILRADAAASAAERAA